MLEHYQGVEGRAALLNALRSQFLVDGNSDIANTMALATQVKEFTPGKVLFTEGERGGDIFLIFSGQVSVRKRGREIATCGAGIHVGEMGLLEPFRGRTASVVAIDSVVVAQISQKKFTEIAEQYHQLWRRMALELAHRLDRAQDAVA